jgi:acyl-coenzyme A synthetase/AMP-(fatty) acid ligase
MSEVFNACEYLLDRQLATGAGERIALTGPAGELTYTQLHEAVLRAAGALRGLGLQPEQRVLMFMADEPQFVIVYLAAMRIGAVPVPVSTMSHADGLADLLRDSRARLLTVSGPFADTAAAALADVPDLTAVLGPKPQIDPAAPLPWHDLDALIAASEPDPAGYPTTEDSPAFWLYTSGTTG